MKMSNNLEIELNAEDEEAGIVVNMSVENNHNTDNGCCSIQQEQHFLVLDGTPPWLYNILSSLDNPLTMCADAFISTLYILIYESGFTVRGGPVNPGVTYNINVLREISDYSFLHRIDSSYKFCFMFDSLPNSCILVAIPVDNIMIVNFYMTDCKTISISFNMNDFVTIDTIYPVIKNGKELSLKFNKALCKIRTRLLAENIADPKHILALPTEILLDICNYLTPPAYFYFSLSCKRIYNSVFNDESVWSKIGRMYLPCRKRSNESWRDFVFYQFQKKQQEQLNRPHYYPDLIDWPYLVSL